MNDELVISVPAIVTLRNIDNKQVSFVPYKENFKVGINAGQTVRIEVATAGQVFYYLSQAVEGRLEVTQAAKA